MAIGDYMNKCVVECTEDAGIDEVYELLQRCDHRMVVVIDSNAHRVPIGVVSERSMCEQIIGRGRNPRTLLAGSMMDTRIKTVLETESLEKINAEYNRDIAALIVVDEHRRVRGLIPRESLGNLTVATTGSSGRIVVSTNRRASPASSEIPGFGWIQ